MCEVIELRVHRDRIEALGISTTYYSLKKVCDLVRSSNMRRDRRCTLARYLQGRVRVIEAQLLEADELSECHLLASTLYKPI
ncbi:MAG: hypothetical protein ACI9VM_000346 [Candidatus Azotimanducaceae bacterium]|jgi:hypothetical protein